jgi:hypothetical protein
MFDKNAQKGAGIMSGIFDIFNTADIFYIADTVLNIITFCFIGFLIWLYLKKDPEDNQ